jgi:hypothetical protein
MGAAAAHEYGAKTLYVLAPVVNTGFKIRIPATYL